MRCARELIPLLTTDRWMMMDSALIDILSCSPSGSTVDVAGKQGLS